MYIKPLSTMMDYHYVIYHSFKDSLQSQVCAHSDKILGLLHTAWSYTSDITDSENTNPTVLHMAKTSKTKGGHIHLNAVTL